MKELFVGKIPPNASASNVVDSLSVFGPISKFDLKQDRKDKNLTAGFGFVEFENDDDADNCIAWSSLFPPECMGESLCIQLSKQSEKKSKERTITTKVSFPLSSIEIGNWGGQKSKRRNDRNITEEFIFLTEWKYPKYYKEPMIHFSKTDEAFILEGFNLPTKTAKETDNLPTETDSPEDYPERRIKIPFRSLAENSRGIFFDARNRTNGEISLYISLKQPPFLYCKGPDTLKSEFVERFKFSQEEQDFWIRTVDWTGIVNIFGRCLVYRLVFKNDLDQLIEVLNKFKIRGIPRPMPQCGVNCEELNYSRTFFDDFICQILPFSICFKLESLISYGKLTLREIEKERLGETLAELVHAEKQEMVAWYALNQISTKYWDPFDKRRQERPISVFKIALRNFRGEFNIWHPSDPDLRLKNDSRCAWVYHATITPTKVYVDGPNYEPSNRILRQYEDKIDRFLRVTFREENFDRLFVHNKNEHVDIINLRISSIVNTGFCIAGRHYEFLAFSSSQLKETSSWFVASDGTFNANFIRANMGDFSNIKSPALYASRMGQCFTSTVGTLKIKPHQVRRIPEIKRNGYEFSDGCGTISMSLAKRATKRYWGKKPKDKEVPSVFQIRFGGCKGVVAVDPSLEGDALCIRPSQTKFEAPDSSILEIVKTVKNPQLGHLNRQIILLLSALGVQDQIFITLQEEMRKDIELMMTDEDKAREIVKRSNGVRESSHVTRTILSLIDAGMMRGTVDPFLKALLECKRVFALKTLRYKARILMPNSFILLGVVDELGILEKDEIYVQTSTIVSESQTFETAYDKVKRKHKVWTGPAVITRNPCLHPGDLRVVRAVDEPKLSHLRNCVVFSQKGDRPVPNLLSGGDLDGDDFFVCFDERILMIENEEPMNYDPPERKIIEDRPVEISDICEFFTDFMLNNRLGIIANLHLALADYNVEGVKYSQCIKLANLHSKAVDFNKTGVPVDDELPNIREYPDFMEHKYKKSYESQKILGTLYRNIKIDKPQSDPLLKYYVGNIVPDDDFLYEGYRDYMEEAIVTRDYYNGEIRNLMKKYKVKTEAEILTAQLLGYKRVDGRKAQDIREAISGTVSHIIDKLRKQFLMGTNNNADNDTTLFNLHTPIPINNESKAKASAWYYVTYNLVEYPDQGGKTCLLSFPWVVADVLLAIRTEKQSNKLNDLLRELSFLGEQITEFLTNRES